MWSQQSKTTPFSFFNKGMNEMNNNNRRVDHYAHVQTYWRF